MACNGGLLKEGRREWRRERHMTDRDKSATDRPPHDLHALIEEAIHNLSLGIVIFSDQRQVVFCNRRYMQMYGLSPEQVKQLRTTWSFTTVPAESADKSEL